MALSLHMGQMPQILLVRCVRLWHVTFVCDGPQSYVNTLVIVIQFPICLFSRENGEANSELDPSSPRQRHLKEAAANQNWQLTVNFGKRYTQLQQLLEWLEVWSNKHHKFGLGRLEAVLELKVASLSLSKKTDTHVHLHMHAHTHTYTHICTHTHTHT